MRGQRRGGGSERGHRVGVGGREVLDEREDVVVDLAVARHVRPEGVEFGSRREVAVPKQVQHFLVAGGAREVLDGVSAVHELAGVAVDEAQVGFGHEHVFEPLLEFVGHAIGSPTPVLMGIGFCVK